MCWTTHPICHTCYVNLPVPPYLPMIQRCRAYLKREGFEEAEGKERVLNLLPSSPVLIRAAEDEEDEEEYLDEGEGEEGEILDATLSPIEIEERDEEESSCTLKNAYQWTAQNDRCASCIAEGRFRDNVIVGLKQNGGAWYPERVAEKMRSVPIQGVEGGEGDRQRAGENGKVDDDVANGEAGERRAEDGRVIEPWTGKVEENEESVSNEFKRESEGRMSWSEVIEGDSGTGGGGFTAVNGRRGENEK